MALKLIMKITGPDESAKVYRDSEWNEYRVRVDGAGPESTYHTDDKADAISTANYLCGIVPLVPMHPQ